MTKNLVIVESPAKAKTIEKYLGKDYLVKSSYGHVRDLPKGNGAIDIENGFKPEYVISPDKKQVISELKKLVKDAEIVWLATDDDREGEAISWHLKEALNLKDDHTKRIVFREITKNAILNAIQTPRTIDVDLVNAQQARRVLDRLVGFELSPVLWKKIKAGLSAGRVQSVAVRMVVEREREVDAFEPKSAYKVNAIFDLGKGKILQADLNKRFDTKEEAKAFLESCTDAAFSIEKLETKPGKKSPAAPFTTSTLQQEASRKLYFSVSQTMAVAQRLYEAGHITYMRTDSVNLSNEARQFAANEIVSHYGEDYLKNRQFKNKSASAQEAHEAIRPTNFANHSISGERNDVKLYDLIWKRAIASQMSDAKLEKTTATIDITGRDEKLVATGEVIKFDGFLKVYIESTDDEDDDNEESKGMLPPLDKGQVLELNNLRATERFSRPPARYTEASLVKRLEEKGIGRPSTYAPTISTIQKRNYVIKEQREGVERKYNELVLADSKIDENVLTEITGAEKNKLFPTNMGMVVNDFLTKNFSNIVDYSFTAKVEEQFDSIASGKIVWNDMINSFYSGFHTTVEDADKNLTRSDAGTTRKLGEHPESGKEMFVKIGKYGPYVQIGTQEDEEKPLYASLRKGQYMDKITLEEALELFKLPRDVGEFEGKKVVAAIGRFGPYVRHDGKFVSLGKELDPHTVDLDTAIELIKAKREADAKKLIKEFEQDADLKVLNGRWGPYISFKKKNYKIPKGTEAESLTYEKCIEIIESTPDKKSGGGGKKKKTAKTESK
ncbi:type I DNA topoisomerase [Chondrinema litorale]|uniref:type I DNA topoisomerase n=1 Tax=Chondrinema litorale TaxID=2994555 RepID=UPI002542E610|nr:type I DNA topoisomerase [Chondrinema litorale]UZR93680.1 type I DNA topoisomerase [Chondrinema litorale]